MCLTGVLCCSVMKVERGDTREARLGIDTGTARPVLTAETENITF